MKVKIGKYVNWIGPYQLVGWLEKFGVSEDRCDAIGKWLSETWVNDVCNWIHDKRDRKVKVKIDYWDVWSMDETLAHIILPMLRMIREDKHGAPHVDQDDVPEELRATQEELDQINQDGSVDDKFFQRWEWIVDEMIFAFESKHIPWESEYMSGNADYIDVPVDKDLNPVDRDKAEYFEMQEGPKHTFKVDTAGMMKHQERISNGFRLFGKYYESLWT